MIVEFQCVWKSWTNFLWAMANFSSCCCAKMVCQNLLIIDCKIAKTIFDSSLQKNAITDKELEHVCKTADAFDFNPDTLL